MEASSLCLFALTPQTTNVQPFRVEPPLPWYFPVIWGVILFAQGCGTWSLKKFDPDFDTVLTEPSCSTGELNVSFTITLMAVLDLSLKCICMFWYQNQWYKIKRNALAQTTSFYFLYTWSLSNSSMHILWVTFSFSFLKGYVVFKPYKNTQHRLCKSGVGNITLTSLSGTDLWVSWQHAHLQNAYLLNSYCKMLNINCQ